MIKKKFKKIGKISKPYYTQNNDQEVDQKLGKLRKRIQDEVGNDPKPYDVYDMVTDQAKRIDVLEMLVKQLLPDSFLDPKIQNVEEVYKKVSERQNQISQIIKEVK